MSTLVKKNGFWSAPSFFDDFLTRDLFDWNMGISNQGGSVPRVNIAETNDDFRVDMAAPGMKKNDFHIELNNDMLTIKCEKPDNQADNTIYTLREFNYRTFNRTFHLPNTVEADKIKALYKDGVLSLVIPKKEEAKRKPARTISIS